MPKIFFYGYYGNQNTGDNSFVEVAAWGASKFWGEKKSIFPTEEIPIITPSVFIGNSHNKAQTILQRSNIFLTNSFVCAGGSTFHSEMDFHNPKKIALLKKKLFPKFKLGAIGVSLGPYRSVNAEKENIELLKRFDFLSLRDKLSFEIASSYNLPYKPIQAFDLAALLPEIYNYSNVAEKHISKKRKILGISLCNYESYLKDGDLKNEKRRNTELENLLLTIAELDNSILFRFFIFNGNNENGDEDITRKTIDRISNNHVFNFEIIEYNPSVYETWKSLSECNFVLSTRLHASIFACFVGIPFFLVEYHRKCADFLESVGYENGYRINDGIFDEIRVAYKMINIINESEEFVFPRYIKQSVELALRNFTQTASFFKNSSND